MRTSNKKRNCYDTFRSRIMLARRAREGNPAVSAAHQLLAVFGILTLTMPKPTIALTPPHHPDSKDQLSRKLGVAKRYLDKFLRSGSVPYSLLLTHVRGAATRRDALIELRKRMPAETLDWLSNIEKEHSWSSLTLCFSLDGDERIELNMLKAAARWENDRLPIDSKLDAVPDINSTESSTGGKGGGGGAPPPVCKPDTDPNKPKP